MRSYGKRRCALQGPIHRRNHRIVARRMTKAAVSRDDLRDIRDDVLSRGAPPIPFVLKNMDGDEEMLGEAPPVLVVTILSQRGARAVRAMGQVALASAYINQDIDLDGDLIRAMELRVLIRRDQRLFRMWSVLAPMVYGRTRHNPRAIAKHYDMNNVQLFAADRAFQTYTPGVYESMDDTPEEAGERRLESVYRLLRLESGMTLLDVGCGWGGLVRYACGRGVDATGITLSRTQAEFATEALRADGLDATIRYADFFTYEPRRKFDAISLMGVMEDLSDYAPVLDRLAGWLEPGGMVYLDFAAVARRFQVSGFIARYVWQGAFRMVHMPQLVAALDASPLEIPAFTTTGTTTIDLHEARTSAGRPTMKRSVRLPMSRRTAFCVCSTRAWRSS